MGVSVLNLDGQSQLAPFEMTSLIVEAFAWCSMLILLKIETRVYIYEFRWFVRVGLIYAIVGEAIMFNIIISVQQLYSGSVLYLHISEVICQVLFGVLLPVYVPTLDPYPGYTPIGTEVDADAAYEQLPEGELICPKGELAYCQGYFFLDESHYEIRI